MIDREQEWSALLRAANAGDRRSYDRFLREVTPVLRGIVRSRARGQSAESHEDILQEVLIAIHAKRHTWDPAAPLLPWLYAVTRYKVVDAYRRQSRHVHLPIEDFTEMLEATAHDVTAAHDSAVLLGQLDSRSAGIVRAISIDGQSAAEVGERLAMTEGAVRVSLHRALQRMTQFVTGAK
jgi:RNA polymerase sigma-70 factor (ECF subfamily)